VESTSKISLKDRFLGCLLGQAIGDALGMPVEGWTPDRIRSMYGWLDRYVARVDEEGEEELRAGEITGDTEMSLCLVEGLISSNGFIDPEAVGIRLIKMLDGPVRGRLGRTTLAAIEEMETTGDYQRGASGTWPPGNGAATRIVPLGLLNSVGSFNPEVFTREVMRTGLITHHDPKSLNGALAIAYAVRLLAADQIPPELLAAEVAAFVDEDDVARKVRLAGQLVQSGGDRESDLAHLAQIGTSSYVAESVAAAIYCFSAHAGDFETAVLTAVNAGGDCDTIASMAGALSGVHLGARQLPANLVDGLEARMYILVAAPGLYRMAQRRAGLFLNLVERE
jgi:ADP-ribosyl-[dinitrogen reductase] hydrolase